MLGLFILFYFIFFSPKPTGSVPYTLQTTSPNVLGSFSLLHIWIWSTCVDKIKVL